MTPRYELNPLASSAAATQLIDQLLAQYKQTFKRKAAVDMFVSVRCAAPPDEQFSIERRRELRRAGVYLPPPKQQADIYGLTIRAADPSDAQSVWDAEWAYAAALKASTSPSTT